MKKFDAENLFFDKMAPSELRQYFWLVFNRVKASSMIVHRQADQLLPQLFMERFDTLPVQYRYIGHLHEEACS